MGLTPDAKLIGSVNGPDVKVDGRKTKHAFLLQQLGRWRFI